MTQYIDAKHIIGTVTAPTFDEILRLLRQHLDGDALRAWHERVIRLKEQPGFEPTPAAHYAGADTPEALRQRSTTRDREFVADATVRTEPGDDQHGRDFRLLLATAKRFGYSQPAIRLETGHSFPTGVTVNERSSTAGIRGDAMLEVLLGVPGLLLQHAISFLRRQRTDTLSLGYRLERALREKKVAPSKIATDVLSKFFPQRPGEADERYHDRLETKWSHLVHNRDTPTPELVESILDYLRITERDGFVIPDRRSPPVRDHSCKATIPDAERALWLQYWTASEDELWLDRKKRKAAKNPAVVEQQIRGAARLWCRGMTTLQRADAALAGADEFPLGLLAWYATAVFKVHQPANVRTYGGSAYELRVFANQFLEYGGFGGEHAAELVRAPLVQLHLASTRERREELRTLDDVALFLRLCAEQHDALQLATKGLRLKRTTGRRMGAILTAILREPNPVLYLLTMLDKRVTTLAPAYATVELRNAALLADILEFPHVAAAVALKTAELTRGPGGVWHRHQPHIPAVPGCSYDDDAANRNSLLYERYLTVARRQLCTADSGDAFFVDSKGKPLNGPNLCHILAEYTCSLLGERLSIDAIRQIILFSHREKWDDFATQLGLAHRFGVSARELGGMVRRAKKLAAAIGVTPERRTV